MRFLFTMLLLGASVSPIEWENMSSYQEGYTGLFEQLWYSPSVDGFYTVDAMEI